MLSINVVSRSYSQLFPPLEHDQTAPLLFLWAQRLAVDLFGPHELALRLVPLLAGISVLVLTYAVARRLLSEPAALVALAIVGFSPMLIFYSNEAKQYGVEALTAVAVCALALRLIRHPESASAFAALVVGGAVAVWASATACFVLASVLLALRLAPATQQYRFWSRAIIAAAVWGLSFGAAYVLIYKAAAETPYLDEFWQNAFVTLQAPGLPMRFWYAFREILAGGFAGSLPQVGTPNTVQGLVAAGILACLVLGIVRMGRLVGWWSVALLVGPLAIALGASFLRLYPIAVRLALFTLPPLAVVVAGGMEAVCQVVPAPRRSVAWVTVAVSALLAPFTRSIAVVTYSRPAEHVRPLLAQFFARRDPGEAVYVSAASVPAWTFYSTDWAMPDSARLAWLNAAGRPGGRAFGNASSRGRAVQDREDVGLMRVSATGTELLGLSSGIQYRQWTGFVPPTPDSGWTGHEARRIRSAANPGVWFLMSHARVNSELAVLDSVRALGGVVTDSLGDVRVVLVRFEFDSSDAIE